MKIPKKYKIISESYRIFGKDISENLIFDSEMEYELYVWETFGPKKFEDIVGKYNISSINGFYHGKKWMDATIKMWKEDLKNGFLFIEELQYNEYIMKKI